MSDFTYDNLPSVATKSDFRAPITPSQEIDSADVNQLSGQDVSLRTAITAGQYHALVDTSGAPLSTAGNVRSRSLASKFQLSEGGSAWHDAVPVKNIKEFITPGGQKVTGDGSTDDTNAIQQAFCYYSQFGAWPTGSNTAFTVGEFCNNAGNGYVCTVAGTSDHTAGGPVGTAYGVNYTDGTVTWQFLGSNMVDGGRSANLFIPVGQYKVTKTLYLTGQVNSTIHIHGETHGMGQGSALVWAGANGIPFIHCQGVNRSCFENFAMLGGQGNVHKPSYMIWMDYRVGTTSGIYPTDNCLFRDLFFMNVDVSTQYGGACVALGNSTLPNGQSDEMIFEKCYFLPWDLRPGKNVQAWQAATAYNVGDLVYSNGYNFLCTAHTGDNLSSGVAPTGAAFQNGIVDNHVTWACYGTSWIQPWAPIHAYAFGDEVTNDSGKRYWCSATGTSGNAGGPTGTGVAIADPGGTAQWNYAGTAVDMGSCGRGSGIRSLTAGNTKNQSVRACTFDRCRIGYELLAGSGSGNQNIIDCAFAGCNWCIWGVSSCMSVIGCSNETGGVGTQDDSVFIVSVNGGGGPTGLNLFSNYSHGSCPKFAEFQDCMGDIRTVANMSGNSWWNMRGATGLDYEPFFYVGAVYAGMVSCSNVFINSVYTAPFRDNPGNANSLFRGDYGRHAWNGTNGSPMAESRLDWGGSPSGITPLMSCTTAPMEVSLYGVSADVFGPNVTMIRSGVPQAGWTHIDVPWQAFAAGSFTGTKTSQVQVLILPTGYEVKEAWMQVTASFANAIAGMTSCVVDLGDEDNGKQTLLLASDMTAAPGTWYGKAADLGRFLTPEFTNGQQGFLASTSATKVLYLTMTTLGKDIANGGAGNLNAGNVRLHVKLESSRS